MNSLTDLKAKASFFFLRYKFRVAFVVGTLAWISMLRVILIFTTPLTQLLLISSFVPLYFGFTIAFSQIIAAPIAFSIETYLYNRKHAPEETDFPELYSVAKEMGYPYSKKIRLTDNPKVESAYTNMTSGVITLPRTWKEKYTLEQAVSILAHELAAPEDVEAFLPRHDMGGGWGYSGDPRDWHGPVVYLR